MAAPAIQCDRCGWQNESTARMCGGCGQPLYTSADTMPYAPEAPTIYTQPVASPDLPQPVVSAPPGGSGVHPAWPEATSAGGKRRPWWRGLLILLIVLGVLAGAGLGAWTLIVRPIVHAQVDSALRGALDHAVDRAAAIIQNAPPVPSGVYRIDPADLNAAIQQELPDGTPLTHVVLSFAGGRTRVSYTLFGRSSFVYSSFYAANGRVMARDTAVYGLLKLVETGPEMQAALNDALARLPAKLYVTGVRVANGALYIRISA